MHSVVSENVREVSVLVESDYTNLYRAKENPPPMKEVGFGVSLKNL